MGRLRCPGRLRAAVALSLAALAALAAVAALADHYARAREGFAVPEHPAHNDPDPKERVRWPGVRASRFAPGPSALGAHGRYFVAANANDPAPGSGGPDNEVPNNEVPNNEVPNNEVPGSGGPGSGGPGSGGPGSGGPGSGGPGSGGPGSDDGAEGGYERVKGVMFDGIDIGHSPIEGMGGVRRVLVKREGGRLFAKAEVDGAWKWFTASDGLASDRHDTETGMRYVRERDLRYERDGARDAYVIPSEVWASLPPDPTSSRAVSMVVSKDRVIKRMAGGVLRIVEASLSRTELYAKAIMHNGSFLVERQAVEMRAPIGRSRPGYRFVGTADRYASIHFLDSRYVIG